MLPVQLRKLAEAAARCSSVYACGKKEAAATLRPAPVPALAGQWAASVAARLAACGSAAHTGHSTANRPEGSADSTQS